MPDNDCLNQRITIMEDDIRAHRNVLDHHDRRLSDLSASLHENTQLTKQIADNTSELVELFRGAKLFRKFILWASPVIVLFYGAYQWITGGK